MREIDRAYNLATDIANVVPCRPSDKRKIRKQILQVAGIAVRSQVMNKSTLAELESMIRYAD